MSPGLTAFLILGLAILFLALEVPLVFALGGMAVGGLFLLKGSYALPIIYLNTVDKPKDFNYLTIPLFIYMAYMLDRSGVAEDLYTAIQYWSGRFAGSLAIGTVFISTVLAAMTGLSSASIITMGVTVLPAMLERGYSKDLTMGCIAAGSTLGILIPPSVLGLLYATQNSISPGRIFLAGVIPGLIIAIIFIIYIAVICYLNPSLGPPLASTEKVTQKVKLKSLGSVVAPTVLVVMVLGSIFAGIATPTESASVGVLGAFGVLALNRKLTWKNLREINYNTLKLTLMIMWVLVGASAFRALCVVSDAYKVIQSVLMSVPFGGWGTMLLIQLILVVIGCFLDEFGILVITMPVIVPIIRALHFDPVWFGVLFIINMQIAELTPPIGLNLFYMQAVAPNGTKMEDIYRAVAPFILLLLLALVIVMLFPETATWLPELIIRKR